MLSEEEFLALAKSRYAELSALQEHKTFYEYEKRFDAIWVELGRQVLEGSISEVPSNPRKKTLLPAATEKSK
jgi:hypothetical protein